VAEEPRGDSPPRIRPGGVMLRRMTYFQYHLVFNLPVLLLLLWLNRGRIGVTHWKWIGVVGLIAFVFTTPWDNWAVHQGMWGFKWDEVVPISIPFRGVVYRLPLEEYAFFLLETINVCLLVNLFLPKPAAAKGT
jgi:putative membrane protein